jgi:hypothetical protein
MGPMQQGNEIESSNTWYYMVIIRQVKANAT